MRNCSAKYTLFPWSFFFCYFLFFSLFLTFISAISFVCQLLIFFFIAGAAAFMNPGDLFIC
jgi:hypothetical protein